MNSETKLLIPEQKCQSYEGQSTKSNGRFLWDNLPLGRLASSNIGGGFLCFFSQSPSTVWVLLANSFSIGKILCTVDNDDEGSDDRTIEAHVGKDAGRMRTVDEV